MAVYTRIADGELRDFVAGFPIGGLIACEPIAEGIENSNYLLRTENGTYILTLFEARVAAGDLPFYLGLMNHLASLGVPCPVPVRNDGGAVLHTLAGKPATVVTFLEGDWPREPAPAHCRELGAAMAAMHLAGRTFGQARENDLSVSAWRGLFAPLANRADELRPGLAATVAAELDALETRWPAALPLGAIHGDLFPDNVFFLDNRLSGIIDFYFACTDFLAYDLAVALDAWCFGTDGAFLPDRAAALVAGYETVRPLEAVEAAALPLLARGAALRFLLTRLHDWFLPRRGALTRRKDPLAFVPLIEFHRGVSDSRVYGLDCAP